MKVYSFCAVAMGCIVATGGTNAAWFFGSALALCGWAFGRDNARKEMLREVERTFAAGEPSPDRRD